MDELNQFLNSVEASARKILKQQNKKQQELIARDRVALARGNKHAASPAKSNHAENAVSRDELRASYASGGSLIIQAPSPHLRSPSGSRRSEHASESFGADDPLPRINPLASNGEEPLRGSPSTGLFLPVIDKKQHKDAAALEAAKKANRERRALSSSVKIFDSPLYKSLAKVKSEQGFGNNSSSGGGSSSSSPQSIKKAIHDVDNVNILLKKMGLRESSSSPSRRPDHAVERRMCNACWAQPTKLTGCEHHNRVLPSNSNSSNGQDPASIIRSLELQGPKSWLSDDLFVKYRSERDREALWDAFVQLKEQEKREEEVQQDALTSQSLGSFDPHQQKQQQLSLKVIPIVTRHPVYHKFFTQIELENLKTQAETRRRNQSRAFIFDVNHIWLTNLDHFNDHLLMRQRKQQQRQLRKAEGGDDGNEDATATSDDDDVCEANSLSDRRDETAISQGFSQIQSISSSRALQNAHFPEFDPSQSSFAVTNRRQASIASNLSSGANSAQEQTGRTSSSRNKKRTKPKVYPLSLLVCGKWQPPPSRGDATPDPLDLVPGLTLAGSKRVLWWRYPHEEIERDGTVELTKVVAMYARDAKLSSSNAILVSVVLALDAPMLSQLWFAWHMGSRAPPPPPVLDPDLLIPCRRVSPCIWSLMHTPLQSRLDSLLPCTMVLLNDVAQSDDHTLSLDEPFGHCRFWPMANKDAFRQWWLVENSLAPDFDVTPRECSVQIAQPNATGVCGRFCWHSTDTVNHWICRRRVEKDYVYIVHNDTPSGSNDPMYFAVSMAHEVMLHVHAAKLAAYLAMLDERRRKRDYEAKLLEIEQKLEVGRLVLEAKRQEQKRIEQELEAAAVLKRAKSASARAKTKKLMPNADADSGSLSEAETASVLQEWDARLQQSVVVDEQGDWQQREIKADDALVVFYHSLNQHLPLIHRFTWERPDTWQERSSDAADDKSEDNKKFLTSRSDNSADSEEDDEDEGGAGGGLDSERQENDEAMTRITRVLLEDEQFLTILKEKLGLGALEASLSEQALANKLQKKNRWRSSAHGNDDEQDDEALQVDWDDQMTMLTEESDVARASLMATKVAKLQLMPREARTSPLNPSAGEGWKRLKNSKLPKNFARSVYLAHTEGPRSAFLNQPNSATPVGMIDPAESSAYDAPEFFPELRALFVPKANADLQEKKLIWAEYERTKPRGPGVMAHASNDNKGQPSGSALDALLEKDPAEAQMSMDDLVNKAILCARSNNLEGVSGVLWIFVRLLTDDSLILNL